MKGIVCLDTNIVIWGILNQAKEHDLGKLEQARYLIDTELKDEKIIIPAIVVTEASIKINDAYDKFVCDLSSRFMIAPYDQLCGKYYMQLHNSNEYKQLYEHKDEMNLTKRELRNDLLVLATAVGHKAKCIYSHDHNHIIKFAKNYIEVRDLPMLPPRQLDMF